MLHQSSDESCGNIIPKLPIFLECNLSHYVSKEDIAFLLFKLKVKRSVEEFILSKLMYCAWLGRRKLSS